MILKKIMSLNILKTLYANFYYFPFKIAIRFPIFIYNNVNLSKVRGVK